MSDTDPTAIFGKSRAEEEAKKKRDETMKSALIRGLIVGGAILAVYVSVLVARADLGMGRYVILGVILFALGKIIRDFEASKITAWKATGYTLITVGSLIILVQILNSGIGALGISSLEKVSEVSQRTACNMNSDLEGCAEIREIDQLSLEVQRQAEREVTVQRAITDAAVIAATAATQTNDVVDGCDQYRYDELARCWTVTLAPNTYYEHRLDQSIPTARCSMHTSNHRDVVYTTPGTTGFNLENTGNSVRQFFVYEIFAGEIGPDRQAC
jgi:hypothetical protein